MFVIRHFGVYEISLLIKILDGFFFDFIIVILYYLIPIYIKADISLFIRFFNQNLQKLDNMPPCKLSFSEDLRFRRTYEACL